MESLQVEEERNTYKAKSEELETNREQLEEKSKKLETERDQLKTKSADLEAKNQQLEHQLLEAKELLDVERTCNIHRQLQQDLIDATVVDLVGQGNDSGHSAVDVQNAVVQAHQILIPLNDVPSNAVILKDVPLSALPELFTFEDIVSALDD